MFLCKDQETPDLDLVEIVQLSAQAVEISQSEHEARMDEAEEEIEDEDDVEEKSEEKIPCMSGCCVS